MHEELFEKILIKNSEIIARCKELGKEVTEKYHNVVPIVVGVLKGCIPFYAELIKNFNFDFEMDFIEVSTYDGKTFSSGEVKFKKDIKTDVKDRDIIVVDDIIDSGISLQFIINRFLELGAKSVRTICLLDKPSGRKEKTFKADFTGFKIPGVFVVGYGLDYEELYRNVDYIGVLKKEVYEGK